MPGRNSRLLRVAVGDDRGEPLRSCSCWLTKPSAGELMDQTIAGRVDECQASVGGRPIPEASRKGAGASRSGLGARDDRGRADVALGRPSSNSPW